ncbi:MAG: PQQ-binding-like beta-propeller repeat protein [Actinophytocola sp.]|nr:PQQ-binding-like beta-propeller repeat protein [Actinophytocola sp.]
MVRRIPGGPVPDRLVPADRPEPDNTGARCREPGTGSRVPVQMQHPPWHARHHQDRVVRSVVRTRRSMRSRAACSTLSLVLVAGLVVGGEASAATGCAEPGHPGGEWRSYGQDWANSRHQAAEQVIGKGNVPTMAPAWVVSTEGLGGTGDITGTPVVADGCVYIASNRGWVYALDADTGDLVWRQGRPGMVNGSVAVEDGKVFVPFDFSSDTYLAAFDQFTGAELWRSPRLDHQTGSDIFGSPVYFDGIVFIGISGLAETSDETTRFGFQGSYVLLDADTGEIMKKTWVIPPEQWEVADDEDGLGYSGATIWSTPAVDPETRTAYVGAGNPFNPYYEHERTNALLKIDLARDSATFGEIVASYKGTIDKYVPPAATETRCVDVPEAVTDAGGGYVESKACGDFDLDMGASPNIFFDDDGRKLVGIGQKSGVYHVVDAESMDQVWTSLVGVPSEVGGIVGSTAYDGTRVYGPHTLAGYLFGLEKNTGDAEWLSPVADGVHWGQPVASANGVVYTVDFKGFLDAYDADTGVPLLHLPMALATHTRAEANLTDPILSWAGVSVARNTVYAAVGIDGEGYGIPQLPNGYLVAYRPMENVIDAG